MSVLFRFTFLAGLDEDDSPPEVPEPHIDSGPESLYDSSAPDVV
jgi:hypothetical protein